MAPTRTRCTNTEFENGDTGETGSLVTVFMGDFPLQTPHGTFIIGGTERVIVSQLVRSPGVYFDRQQDRTSDKEVFGAKIIPSRGAWLEFEIDKKDQPQVRVDRKRKQSAIVFLMAIGMTKSEIAQAFKDYPLVLDALEKETLETQDEALVDLYRKIRPADTPTPEAGKNLLDSFYFNTKRYDLARRPLQDQPQAGCRGRFQRSFPPPGRHHRHDQVPGGPARRCGDLPGQAQRRRR